MISPFGEYVVIKRDEAGERETGFGLVIAAVGQSQPETGTVVASGPEALANVGSRVLFSKYAGQEVVIDNEKHILVRQRDIFGVLG